MGATIYFGWWMSWIPTFCLLVVSSIGVANGYQDDAAALPANDTGSAYRDEIKQLVRLTLDKHDTDNDGQLDANEIAKVSWGEPPPTASDLNADGILTKIELAARYKARLDAKANGPALKRKARYQSAGSPYSRYARALMNRYDTDKDGLLDQRELSKMRRPIRDADSNGDQKLSLAEIVDRLKTKTTSAQVQADENQAPGNVSNANEYANQLITQYDENNDGVLDRSELAKMRRPPRADADAVGTIDKNELVGAILNRKQSQALARALGGMKGDAIGGILGGGQGNVMGGSVMGGAGGIISRGSSSSNRANRSRADARVLRVNFRLFQLDDTAETAKLNQLAETINGSDKPSLAKVLGEFKDESLLSDDEVFATLTTGKQFKYNGGFTDSQIVGRQRRGGRAAGESTYGTQEVDVGFKLYLVPKISGDQIRLAIEADKSFIDKHAKPANEPVVLFQPIRKFHLETELSFSNGEAAAGVFSSSGRKWMVIVTGYFEGSGR